MRPVSSLLLTFVLTAGALHAGETLRASDASAGLRLRHDNGVWTLERRDADALPLDLPRGFEPFGLEALRDGWVMTGTVPVGQGRELRLLRGLHNRDGDEVRLLPAPAERIAAARSNPIVIVEQGRVGGLAWVEGDRQETLVVRAAAWTGRAWGPVEEVSSGHLGWSAQLALTGVALLDGDWLLLWSGFDGEDDEILWSRRSGTLWSAPRRLHPDNRAPDVTPSVVATADGALAAWSGYHEGHYRLHLAHLDDEAWRLRVPSEAKGVVDPRVVHGDNGIFVLFRSVMPDGWHLLELDLEGTLVRRRFLPDPGPSSDRPSEGSAGGSMEEFRYMAFGDSITFGSFDELSKGGYPGRLGPLLGCSPGVCEVVNQGFGGERTGAGLSRIGGLLQEGSWDVVMVMEGTNDIFRNPPISNNTIQFNLEGMADKATENGVDTVLASIIRFHPDGTRGNSRDAQVEDLKNRLQGVATNESYYFVNPWAVLCPNRPCFDQHYFGGVPSPDPVGHPDASGYDILADLFRDGIVSVPVPASPSPVLPSGDVWGTPALFRWARESPVRATWYELSIDDASGTVFTGWFRAAEICQPTFCIATPSIRLDVGPHTFRIRGRNPQGRSAWSADGSFTVWARMPPESVN